MHPELIARDVFENTPQSMFVHGNMLLPEDRQHVLAAFVHRFTRDHKPAWACGKWKRGDGPAQPYPVQFASDADWLANTLFAVRRDGRLDRRHNHCQSSPTWPDNPELRLPVAA